MSLYVTSCHFLSLSINVTLLTEISKLSPAEHSAPVGCAITSNISKSSLRKQISRNTKEIRGYLLFVMYCQKVPGPTII